MTVTPQQAINQMVWECIGPETALTSPWPDAQTEFEQIQGIIRALLNQDAEALGKEILNFASASFIDQLCDREAWHGHDLVAFLEQAGLDVSMLPVNQGDDYSDERKLDERDRARDINSGNER
jgi:hypothetical protein